MEVSGVVMSRVACLHGSVKHAGCSTFRPAGTGSGVGFSGRVAMGILRTRRSYGALTNGFADKSHLQYYYKSPKCGCVRQKAVEKEEKKEMKKKMKLLKGLSKDLSKFSGMNFGLNPKSGLVGDVQTTRLAEAAELLIEQLEQLRTDEKEQKNRKKESKMNNVMMKSSSSMSESSSESSDSESGEVGEMNHMRNDSRTLETKALIPCVPNQLSVVEQDTTPTPDMSDATSLKFSLEESTSGRSDRCCSVASISCGSGSSVAAEGNISSKRIEVCMGGKCKKSGGAALLEEFQKTIGIEGAVVACKCMGKCRQGPNIRVRNSDEEILADTVRKTPKNSPCIGVCPQDIGAIVSRLLGDTQNDIRLPATS